MVTIGSPDEAASAKTPYKYGGEWVHLVNFFDMKDARARCFGCKEELHISDFEMMYSFRYDPVRGSRLRRGMQAHHPLCFSCRKHRRDGFVADGAYSSGLDKFWNGAVKVARSAAHDRGLVFAISKDDAVGMHVSQGGRCALSGLPLDFDGGKSSTRSGRSWMRPSLDRIDSYGNYTLNNVHVVASVVNLMKNDLPLDDFVTLCERVAAQRLEAWV